MNFYRAFEERHRGSRAVVKERLRAYAPFLQPLRKMFPAASAVDLGCGRGEWLELLGELGFQARGVDLDDAMLEGCRAAGLSAERGDALAFLRALPDASQVLVSAFHLVEHLPFDQVQALVADAFRVLVPGGLLVLETPNPENIVVATSGFYLDPTHRHPLPPELLAFLPEYHGFARARTVRLQEPKELHDGRGVSLLDVLGSASPDHSVVAQKAGSPEQMQALDDAFAMDFGISLLDLAQRYDASRRSELAVVEDHANRLAEQARGFDARLAAAGGPRAASVERLEREVQALRERLADTNARLAAAGTLLADLMDELHHEEDKRRELEDLLVHRRAPRGRSSPALSDARAAAAAPGAGARLAESASSLVGGYWPGIRRRIIAMARRLRIDGPLRRVYHRVTGVNGAGAESLAPELPPLTPRAQEIQHALQLALANKDKAG